MNTHQLSKSSFLMGLKCDKGLYLYKYHYDWGNEVDASTQALFDTGHRIGELARELFPGGIDVSPASVSEYYKSVERTAQEIQSGKKIIYEAAFIYNGVLVTADILVNEQGKWKAFEVKSSTEVKDTYIYDAAIQYYVLTGAGIKLSDFSIVYINNQYTRNGSIDVKSLFTIQSIKKEIVPLQGVIKDEVAREKEVLRLKEIPDIDINEKCFDPYDCAFEGYCWDKIPEDSVFDISGLNLDKKFRLYRDGIIKIEDVPDDFKLSRLQQIQVECHKQCCPHINEEAVSEFLDSLQYPLYFMDFETFNPAIPFFDQTRPYQQIPFQFSVHYQADRLSEPEHREFLSDAKVDPRPQFIKKLLEAVKGKGDIIVYNAAFEKGRLNELSRDFPQYAGELQKVIERIKDLMVLFRSKDYYIPEFKGGYSIKNVLPALVPELSYDELEIGDGGTASRAFEALQYEEDDSNAKEIRTCLIEYCKLDTFAMVKILEKLIEEN